MPYTWFLCSKGGNTRKEQYTGPTTTSSWESLSAPSCPLPPNRTCIGVKQIFQAILQVKLKRFLRRHYLYTPSRPNTGYGDADRRLVLQWPPSPYLEMCPKFELHGYYADSLGSPTKHSPRSHSRTLSCLSRPSSFTNCSVSSSPFEHRCICTCIGE